MVNETTRDEGGTITERGVNFLGILRFPQF